MIRKKNKFFTFIFSFVPGAGQMYMGFMKRGLSLMSYFILIISISVWLNIGPLMLIALIIWFYSFFDTQNLSSTPDDEFYSLEDQYLIFPEILEGISYKKLQKKYRNILAVSLIIIGFTILWNNFYSILSSILPEYLRHLLYNIGYYLPQVIIGVAIMYFGIYLIKGKKHELDDLEDDEEIYEETNKPNDFEDSKEIYKDNKATNELDNEEVE